MKPLKLDMQAFGPFAVNESINFQDLGINPLFLINGPTGAGKSSILDAICFALYGRTTGDDRTPDQMRCDFADISLLTEVTFEFSIASTSYKIRRVPMQERAKAKGEGTTIQNSEANLWQLEDSGDNQLIVSSKVTDADNYIKQLIGLDVEQFRQVMVLPQGKFREFLLADSKKREEIFGQLFQTSIYKRIEDGLKRKASDIERKMTEWQNTIKGYLESAGVSTENELKQSIELIKPKLERAKKEKTQKENDKQIAQKAFDAGLYLNKKFEILNSKNKEYEDHIANQNKIEMLKKQLSQAVNAQQINGVYEQSLQHNQAKIETQELVNLAANKVQQAEKDYKQTAISLTFAKKEFQNVSKLQTQLHQQKQNLTVALDLERAKETYQRANSLHSESQKKLEAKELKKNRAIKEFEETVAKISNLTKETAKITDEKIKLQQLNEILANRRDLNQINNNINANIKDLEDAKEVNNSALLDVQLAEKNANTKEMTWHLNQAAELAKELNDGQPCPVCGSRDHPEKAKHTDIKNVVSKSDVQLARNIVSEKRKVQQIKNNVLISLTNKLEQEQNNQKKLANKLNDYANRTLDSVAQEVESQTFIVKDIESKAKAIEQLNSLVTQIEQSTKQYEIELLEIRKALTTLNNDKIQAKTVLDGLVERLANQQTDITKIKQSIDQDSKEIEKLTEAHEVAIKNEKLSNEGLLLANEQLSYQREQLDKLTVTASKAKKKWNSTLKSSDFTCEEHFKNALLDIVQQSNMKIEIETYEAEIQLLRGALNQLNNDLKNKTKVDVDELKESLEQSIEVFKERETLLNSLIVKHQSQQQAQLLLEKAKKENEKLDKEYSVTGTLANVACGKSGNKISLQRFVLSVLLDDVLIQATQRLIKMSKGRYQLVRKDDRSKGNKASGLELLVDDTYTGKERPVATLSGGESFLAALSLALGLSDVVQSYSGGIQLDTLFIDEGFGTLDPESLELAISTLIDLQATGRTIGIISHVSELKNQMALRIDITTDKNGSQIKTVGV